MGKREPWHQRSAIGYTLITLFAGFVTVVVFTPLGNYIEGYIKPVSQKRSVPAGSAGPAETTSSTRRPDSDEGRILDKTPPKPAAHAISEPKKTQLEDAGIRDDAWKERLIQQYDSCSGRFAAIDTSLHKRSADLNGLPIKPEIVTALETSRSDLAAVKEELSRGELEHASQRLKRLEESLKYLESL
jgi:hypothetical protein